MVRCSSSASRIARLCDRIARWVITLGGAAVIAGVAGILALIVGVTVPLFRAPSSEIIAEQPLDSSVSPSSVLALGGDASLDRKRVAASVWTADGSLITLDMFSGKVAARTRAQPPAEGATLVSVEPLRPADASARRQYCLCWSDGASSLVEEPEVGAAELREIAVIPADGGKVPVKSFLRIAESGSLTYVALLGDAIEIIRQTKGAGLLEEDEFQTHLERIEEPICAQIASMAVDSSGSTIYAGTRDGRLVQWRLDASGAVADRDVVRAFRDDASASVLGLLLGDCSIVVGDSTGGLSTWFPVRVDGKRRLRMIHTFEKQSGRIQAICTSPRNRTILSLGADGAAHLDYATSERRLLSLSAPSGKPLVRSAFGPRGDVVVGMAADGRLAVWRIDSPHPEVSWKTLFGKVHYEGYDEPGYVWQTTGGDDFEPKFSIVPLAFGTMKGTFYSMLLALPLALGGAAYVSVFTTPRFKGLIKPVVEVMAAAPSVVVGFLAALWLAPLLERWALAFFLSLVSIPAAFLVFLFLWQGMRRFDFIRRFEGGYEFLIVLPALAAGAALAVCLAPALERSLFGGSFLGWLYEGPLGMRYDPRNNIIIAFGLGFAVMPIIFSIAEDAITSVPSSMAAASMALGASRWQTFYRVILPSASPGIFAAVMVGFGRAVGETMIVLMATGNTPTMDWSFLNGMRTLAANIAVEMPEAPVNGTLYRVLFLCAVLLFAMTFVLNTTAEIVRQRLRKKYGRL